MHNIFGDRFLGKREPAWHGLGQTFEEELMPLEAIERIGMNYTVAKVPLKGEAFGRTITSGEYLLVREPTPDSPEPVALGRCGSSYSVIQNSDIAGMLEPLAEQWPVETAGALEDGKAMFLTLDAGIDVVSNGRAEEEIHRYFLATNRHDQGRSLRFALTPIRVVCQNTLIAGLADAEINVGITHHKNAHDDMALTVKLVAALRKAQQSATISFNRMACKVLTPEEVGYIIAAAYVLPTVPQKAQIFDQIKDNKDILKQFSEEELLKLMAVRKKHDYEVGCLQNYRAAASERFEAFNDEQPAFANTGWAVYNGITETECWRNGNKNTEYDILFGRRAEIMGRAYEATMAVVNGEAKI